MGKSTLSRQGVRAAVVLVCALALTAIVLEVTENEAADVAAAGEDQPAHVVAVPGTDLSRVTLSRRAAERIGLTTAAVRSRADRRKAVPYSAVLYDEQGRTWVYTSPGRLTYIRAPITVDVIAGELAVLSAGPPAGTAVVAVGAAELYGAEFGVDH